MIGSHPVSGFVYHQHGGRPCGGHVSHDLIEMVLHDADCYGAETAIHNLRWWLSRPLEDPQQPLFFEDEYDDE
jgi:hypothetical protein